MTDKLARVKAQFEAEGVSIAEWSRINGFNVLTVYRVISGKAKAIRGESYKIALALGLRKPPAQRRFGREKAA